MARLWPTVVLGSPIQVRISSVKEAAAMVASRSHGGGNQDGSANASAVHPEHAADFDGEIQALHKLADLQAGGTEAISMLRMVIESMRDAVVLVDRGYRVLEINSVALEMLGLPPNTRGLVLTPDLDPGTVLDGSGKVLTFDDSPQVRCLAGEVIENEEHQHITRDGTRYLIVHGSPIYNQQGEVAMALIVARDVTELKNLQIRTERMLAEISRQQASLMSVINHMPVGVIVLDSELKILAANKAYSSYFTGDTAWQIGTPVRDVLPNAEESGIISILRRVLDTNRPVKVREFSYTGLPHGTTYWRGSAVPVRLQSENGPTDGVLVVTVDVTDEVRNRQQLQELYQREHTMATRLQTSLLPDKCPCVQGFDIAQSYRPALDEAVVGGDFYDIFRLSDDRYAVMIGDVAGKGIRAALYTAMTKYMLRAYALEDPAPDAVVARLNEALVASTPSEVFVTLIYGILDTRTCSFAFVNAGHEQPLLYSAQTGEVRCLDSSGQALALVGGFAYSVREIRMAPGDVLLVYTDGISDAGAGPDANRFGRQRTAQVLEDSADRRASELAEELLGRALEYAGGSLSDDAAIVVLKCLGNEQADSW